jgi:hypothetical protein
MEPIADHGSHLPGGTHRQADLDEELAADDLELTPERDELDVPGVTMNDELLQRSDLAIFLLPSAFPASAVTLVETAREQGAPPEILERLQQLPPRTYETVQEVWVALGGPTEHRDGTMAAREGSGGPPSRRGVGRLVPPTPGWVDGVARAAGRMTEMSVRVVLGGTVVVVRGAAGRMMSRRHAR